MDEILELVQNGDFDPIKMFTGNKDKFVEVKSAIESISNNLSKEVCIKFVITKVIPTVFDKNVNNSVRDEAIDVGLHFLNFVNIKNLDTKEQDSVLTSIEEAYIKIISDLRDNNYPNWDKLWIFVLKLCGDKLHVKCSIGNKLLKIVELAFRNANSQDRLKAYDCWHELINNCSSNIDYLTSPKEIKLLVTPLKARFSRTPVVIIKRCDTFIYLLKKLQDKATLCLKEFLEFCFGPFDDKSDKRKEQGRGVREVCSTSTKVLLEIIGHSHVTSDDCLRSDEYGLYSPLITNVNFSTFADVMIGSVIECCVVLNEWSQNTSQNNIVMKCLWRSLLRLVNSSDEETKKKCSTLINNSLRKLLENSHQNEYLYAVLGNIIDLLIEDGMAEKWKEILFEIGITILNHSPAESCFFDDKIISNFLISCFEPENGSKFDKIASNSFKKDTKCNSSVLCDVWLKCKITVVPDNVSNLIWPVRHLQHFSDIKALNSKWTKVYNECKSENIKVTVMQEMEKLFSENPLLGSNVVHFLQIMSTAESSASKDFVARFMRLIELVLTLPNLPDADIKKLSSIVLVYCNPNQHFYKTDNNDETVDKLCGCLEHLMTIHKDYTILKQLTSHLKNNQPKILAKFSKRLMTFLESLMLNDDYTVVNDTGKLIELLECKENDTHAASVMGSRSLRIVNMANVTPKARKPVDKMNSLNIFTKKVEKPSPLSLKSKISSPINNDKNAKKKESLPSLNDDRSSNYVKIDTGVKIDLNKLTEHQREVLKKRREDIPALYQDLTQSQSHDCFEKTNDVENKKDQKEEEDSSSKKRRRQDDDNSSNRSKSRRISINLFTKKLPEVEEIKEDDVVEDQKEESKEELSPKTKKRSSPRKSEPVEEKPNDATIIIIDDNEDVKNEATVDEVKEEDIEIKPESSELKKEERAETPTKEETKAEDNSTPSSSPPKSDEKNVKKKPKFLRDGVISDVMKNLEKSQYEGIDIDSMFSNDDSFLRKSKRQIKRTSSYAESLRSKKKPEEIKDVSPNEEKENSDDLIRKKRNKSKPKKTPKDPEESIEDLLARIDKRIEERKKKENEDLQDGNQNEITEETKQQKKDRQLIKAKRRIDVNNQVSKSDDVYEFKADDESVSDTIRRDRKKRRNRSSGGFSRSDYARRRRKAKSKEVTLPYHVTADFDLPLNKSDSLVPVTSEETETITILFTTSTENGEKKSPRRKQILETRNSEDIIESSQKSPELQKKRHSTRSTIVTSEESMENASPKEKAEKLLALPSNINKNNRRHSLIDLPLQVKEAAKRNKRSLSLDELDDTTEINFTLPSKKHVNDTSADTLTCNTQETVTADTLTLSPVKNNDLPGSPVTCDTPDRTTELLNNTFDISPISFAQDDEALSSSSKQASSNEITSERAVKLLRMVNSNVPVGNETRWFSNKFSSPSCSRVRKMRIQQKEENLDYLTFSREIPSPLTLPSSGILKRKLNNFEDSPAPSPKRKRVNFSDPAITEKKLFVKETEEYIDNENEDETVLQFKEFSKNMDNDKLKTIFKHLVQHLKLPQSMEIITDNLSTCDSSTTDEITKALIDNSSSEKLVDMFISPVIQDTDSFERIMPKLLDAMKTLSYTKLKHFINEITKISGDERNTSQTEAAMKNFEDQFMELGFDKLNDLIKTYYKNSKDDIRNEFLVDLMNFTSSELPGNAKFADCQVLNLHKFLQKMMTE